MRVAVFLLLSAVAALSQAQSSTNDGEALYRERCASCHDGNVARAPRRDAIAHLSAESVRVALTSGSMQSQASGLTTQQIDALVRVLATSSSAVAHAQPAVVGGRIFVGTAARRVYSLDARTGCQYWAFDTDGPVRTVVTLGDTARGWLVYFGDATARAYAVDAQTGALVWKTKVDEHQATVITGAPTLADGILYVPASSFEEALGANPKY